MEEENDNDDSINDNEILVNVPLETVNTGNNYNSNDNNSSNNDDNSNNNNNMVDDKTKVKLKPKKEWSDEKFARYLQEMWDVIDQDELPVYYPSEGTAPRSTFRFSKNDIREEQEEQEEIITYMDADDLGFLYPSEGSVPRSIYVKAEIDEINDESDELDDYEDEVILSSPVRNETIIMIRPMPTQMKEFELKDRETNS